MNDNADKAQLRAMWQERTGSRYIPQKELIDKIFNGVMDAMRENRTVHPDIFMPHLLTGQRKENVLNVRENFYLSIRDIFEKDCFGPQARRAFEMDEEALDFCCREIVHTYLPAYKLDMMRFCEETAALAAQNSTPPLDKTTQRIVKKALEDVFPEYQKQRYRLLAGPVFGFITDAPDRDNIVNAYGEMIANTIKTNIQNRSPDI